MRLAIVSHSLLAPTAIHAPAAPAIMQACMPGVVVDNWAVDGNTNFRQLNSGQNALIAASKPDVLMIGLQINDVIPANGETGGVDGRTLAQVEGDAAELFNWYKTNIPGVRLIHLQEFDGIYATPQWVTFNQTVATQSKWDGFSILGYEDCVAAALLVNPNAPAVIDTADGFGHPSRITCHMQAANILASFGTGPGSWFGLPAQLATWSNVAAFIAAFKANDPEALAATKSLTT